VDVQDESRLAGLCASIAERARGLGHDLAPWEAPPGEEGVAQRTLCRRCGRTVYARVEGDLMGVSGAAAREPCS